MADKPASERTEKATPERLRKARKEGKVPQSNEVGSALMIITILITLAMLAPFLYGWFTAQMQDSLSLPVKAPLASDALLHVLKTKATQALVAATPFFLAAGGMSILSSMLVGGWTFAPEAAKFKISRISPISGLKRLFSLKSTVHLLISLAKLALLLIIVYVYLKDKLPTCLALQWTTASGSLVLIAQMVFGLVARIAVGLVAIAGIDWLYQRWNYKRDLRMTKQQVKEERRQHEISPELRQRIRSIQTAMSRKRMLADVPKADVVITNPTHVAVALLYDAQTMNSPQVLAKGAELLSEKIKEIAREHNVPIVEKPQLARTLYDSVDVGQSVPETLFLAVAEVLAMIYRIRGRRRSQLGNNNIT